MITILVGANEDAGLKTALTDEKSMIRVVSLQQIYE